MFEEAETFNLGSCTLLDKGCEKLNEVHWV